MRLQSGSLSTTLYTKPTDKNGILHASSALSRVRTIDETSTRRDQSNKTFYKIKTIHVCTVTYCSVSDDIKRVMTSRE